MRPLKNSVPSAAPQPGGGHPRTRILVVEDNPFDAELCTKGLRDVGPEFDLVTVTSLADATRALETAPYDIVITDYQLPDGNAEDVVRVVRDTDPEIPCIVLTGTLDGSTAARSTSCRKTARAGCPGPSSTRSNRGAFGAPLRAPCATSRSGSAKSP